MILVKGSLVGSEGETKVPTVGDTTIRWTQTNDGAAVTYERHGILQRRAAIVSRQMAIGWLMRRATACLRQNTAAMEASTSETGMVA